MENVKELIESLLSKPEEITKIQHEILKYSDEFSNVQNEMVRISAKIKTEINNKLDDNGKKLYTNGESRDAAFTEISNSDSEYKEIENRKDSIDTEIKNLRIKLEEVNNVQRNIRSVLPVFYIEKN